MKHQSLVHVFLFLSFATFIDCSIYAQYQLFNQEYDISKQFNLPQAETKEYKEDGKLVLFNEEKHRTKLAKELLEIKVGKKVKQEGVTNFRIYKVLASTKVMHHRLRYIFIDGNKLSKKELKDRLAYIRSLLDKKVKFESVARQYSMARNARTGGDSGWFKKDETHPKFFKAATSNNRYANEVFFIEVPEQNWYYLVKKTYSPKPVREILVLKTLESR